MNRRTLLRKLGGSGLLGLCGCVSPPASSSPSTDSVPEDVQRRVSLNGQDTVPEEANLRIEATVLEPTITDSQTARIRVTTTNTGSARRISVSTGNCALFNRYSQTSNPRGVWLGRNGGSGHIAETGPRWVADPPDNGAFPDYGCDVRAYESGESVSAEYAIFDDNRTGDYLNEGTYRFARDAILIAPGLSAGKDADASITISWGFSITIENPHCTLCS